MDKSKCSTKRTLISCDLPGSEGDQILIDVAMCQGQGLHTSHSCVSNGVVQEHKDETHACVGKHAHKR